MPASLRPGASARVRRLLPALAALAFPAVLGAHDAPGEYFFGADPGPGLATPLAAFAPPPALPNSVAIAVPASAAPGNELSFGIRFRDAAGNWGQTARQSVHVVKNAAAPGVEWTWTGAFSPAQAAIPASDGAVTISLPDAGPATRLLVRPQSGGVAGLPAASVFSAVGGARPTRLRYAFDQKVDFATAKSLPLTPAHFLRPTPLLLPDESLAPGFHTLHLQVGDEAANRTETVHFLHVAPGAVRTLAGLAYAFVEEGHALAATPFVVTPILASAEPQDIAVPVPGALPEGHYDLVLRLADASGTVAFPATLDLGLLHSYEAWVLAHWSEATPGDAGMLADPDGDQIVNLLEYAFGLDPQVAETAPPYTFSADQAPAGSTLTAVYRQRMGGTGLPTASNYTAGGLRYVIEASTDLQTWLPFDQIDGLTADYSTTPNGDGTETVNFTLHLDAVLARDQHVFARLNVSVVP